MYKHFQVKGAPAKGGDDFHSPVQPQRYIDLRIEKNISFYQDRIPRYNRAKSMFKLLIVFLTVAASALAQSGMVSFVVAVTSASAALTSWVVSIELILFRLFIYYYIKTNFYLLIEFYFIHRNLLTFQVRQNDTHG